VGTRKPHRVSFPGLGLKVIIKTYLKLL